MYSLLKHNTFGIDVSCDEFLTFRSQEELIEILPRIRSRRWLQIGGGSNLVFVGDYHGTVLHCEDERVEILSKTKDTVRLKAGAGKNWDDFVDFTVKEGYYGLENLSLIPGEVGASAVQNIGAYGVEACNFIRQVETVEVETGEARVFSVEELDYGYRHSAFKDRLKERWIITSVIFELSRTFLPRLNYGGLTRELTARKMLPEEITAECLREIIIDVRRRKLPDPKEIGSAGSFFMNPVVNIKTARKIAKDYPDMPNFEVKGGVKIPAAWMIEQCGWKGKTLGRVGVYEKQALVLVNRGGATGEEVLALCEAIRGDVFRKFGVKIVPEAIIIKD